MQVSCRNRREEKLRKVDDMVAYSTAQKQRLTELNADRTVIGREFENSRERDAVFRETEKQFVKENKAKLRQFLENEHVPLTLRIEEQLTSWQPPGSRFRWMMKRGLSWRAGISTTCWRPGLQ